MQISDGTKICLHIDYEMELEEGLGTSCNIQKSIKNMVTIT